MNDAFTQLFEATTRHLEDLRNQGARFVSVSPETRRDLARPAPVAPPQNQMAPGSARPEAAAISTPTATKDARAAAVTLPATVENTARTAKEAAMAALRERALVCVKCSHLAASRKNVVFGVGDIHAPLLFVGEAPGADEDEQGEPFVGKAGQLLTRIIQTMGFSRQTVYIANVLKCRPDTPGETAGNRKPRSDEMKTCLPYLLAQIDIIQPRVIVALGATAVEGLFGSPQPIGKIRGHFQMLRGTPIMPTFHPAYLLRNQALTEKRKVWEDMLQVLEKLERPISDKQRGFFLKA